MGLRSISEVSANVFKAFVGSEKAAVKKSGSGMGKASSHFALKTLAQSA